MSNVKNTFSIKDLENLTGIKAHTIRIWEKRYNILEPLRTETNIRYYDLKGLQKILNITLLHDYGYKISKISKLPPEKIPELVSTNHTNVVFLEQQQQQQQQIINYGRMLIIIRIKN